MTDPLSERQRALTTSCPGEASNPGAGRLGRGGQAKVSRELPLVSYEPALFPQTLSPLSTSSLAVALKRLQLGTFSETFPAQIR